VSSGSRLHHESWNQCDRKSGLDVELATFSGTSNAGYGGDPGEDCCAGENVDDDEHGLQNRHHAGQHEPAG